MTVRYEFSRQKLVSLPIDELGIYGKNGAVLLLLLLVT
jgi:hypothetical protein